MKNLVILTGAGVSAESGINTFRDSGGLWEGHDVMEVASPEGWARDRALVQNFYNKRRAQLKTVEPNLAHRIIAGLERNFEVHVITQNVDDLHERAGSTNVLHLHGELLKARSSAKDDHVVDWTEDITDQDKAADGSQLRPHIVWFGEAVPMMDQAIEIATQAEIFLIVGTSLQVYPAAGLSDYVPTDCEIIVVDPKPAVDPTDRITVVPEPATVGMTKVEEMLSRKSAG